METRGRCCVGLGFRRMGRVTQKWGGIMSALGKKRVLRSPKYKRVCCGTWST